MNVKIPSIFRTYVLPLMRVIRDQFWMDRKRRLKLVGRPNYKMPKAQIFRTNPTFYCQCAKNQNTSWKQLWFAPWK